MKRLVLTVFILFLGNSLIFASVGILPGTGTESDPYLIEDFADFQTFCDLSNAGKYWSAGVYTRLETDLNLSPEISGRQVYNSAPIAPDSNNDQWFSGTEYKGNFDGSGHVITSLTIDGSEFCGLFGQTGSEANISNLGLVNLSITDDYNAGGLVGTNKGTISKCFTEGIVKASGIYGRNAGGLVGGNSGTISQCYSTCDVESSSEVGGLAGSCYEGIISNCYSIGNVNSIGQSGGFVGLCENSTITNCYSTGYITGTSWYSTGFVGLPNFNNTFENCFNYIYSNPSTINLATSLNDEELTENRNFEGFDFAGYTYDGTEDIWDIDHEYDYENDNVIRFMPRLSWQNSPGFQPPYYWDNLSTTITGSGTEQNPFIIAGYEDLMELKNNPRLTYGHFCLAADIDLIGYEYETAFIARVFGGHFDGNGHKISNLRLVYNEDNPDSKILCFILGSYGTIKNLTLENLNILAEEYDTGGITCWNAGDIINCHVSGTIDAGSHGGAIATINHMNITRCSSTCTISGGSTTGGLVGNNSPNANISESYSTGQVSSLGYAGGLVGENTEGIIRNCYSICSVNGKCSGGLVGTTYYGDIAYCYSSGSVAGDDITGGFIGINESSYLYRCFWDKETSGTDTAYFEEYESYPERKYRAVKSVQEEIEGKCTTFLQNYKDWKWNFVYGEYGIPYENIIWYIRPNEYPSIVKIDKPVEIIDWWITPGANGANGKLYIKVRNNTEHDLINIRTGFWNTEEYFYCKPFINYDYYLPINNIKAGETIISEGFELRKYYDESDFQMLERVHEFDFAIQRVDICRDKIINMVDFAMLSSIWQNPNCSSYYDEECRSDIDRSGVVDIQDLIILSQYWLENY